jgi:hypothetical protein
LGVTTVTAAGVLAASSAKTAGVPSIGKSGRADMRQIIAPNRRAYACNTVATVATA